MRRWTLRVLCWLALGAVVNVTAAWGYVLLHEPLCVAAQWGGSTKKAWPAPEYLPPDARELDCVEGGYTNAWITHRNASRGPQTTFYRVPRDPHSDDAFDFVSMTIEEYGWPKRALRLVHVCIPGNRDIGGLYEAFMTSPRLPSWLRLRCYPFGPLWPGLLLNTLFYAATSALLWFLPGGVKRWHRRRHHLCIHCAYPVADPAKPCSECGRLPTTR